MYTELTMEKNIIQKIVLAGAVLRGNKILILQRHANESVYPNMWELPSGKREPLETSAQGLLREVQEEAGLTVSILMPYYVFEYKIEKEIEIRDTTQINFLVSSDENAEVLLSEEHQAFKWISVDEVDQYNVTEETKKVIQKAFEVQILLEKK